MFKNIIWKGDLYFNYQEGNSIWPIGIGISIVIGIGIGISLDIGFICNKLRLDTHNQDKAFLQNILFKTDCSIIVWSAAWAVKTLTLFVHVTLACQEEKKTNNVILLVVHSATQYMGRCVCASVTLFQQFCLAFLYFQLLPKDSG